MQVFEHEKIIVGQDQFLQEHWNALSNHKKLIDSGVITLYNNAIKFSEFVGVIQVGSLTIEILPKIDRDDQSKNRWQQILIEMLKECHWMRHQTFDKAPLKLRHNSILDAYLEMFLNLCEGLLHQGLIKKYRNEESNKYVLKGKLIVFSNIRKNIIHQERFYTQGTIYDRNNTFNCILLKAIKFIPSISGKSSLKDRVNRLLLDFPELPDIKVDIKTFKNLVFDRKTNHYKEAIDIAAMLLLNYRPDIIGGRNHVLAILFDMNKLWEEYVFRQLRKSLPDTWEIEFQSRMKFWELKDQSSEKGVKPDIVIISDTKKVTIIDTKWKLPEDNIPDDSDLKQMFVYNEYWGGQDAVLLYPRAKFSESPEYIKGRFANKFLGAPAHNCGIMKVSVLDKENIRLNEFVGVTIFTFLKSIAFA
jgi:5-methylcytosine-specific restriction enzyme subunit McrC